MQSPVKIAVPLALVLGALVFLLSGPSSPAPPPATPAEEGVPRQGPWWPLEVGNVWRYRVVGGEPGFQERVYQVRRASGDRVRVFEYTDGQQTDDFLTRCGEGDEVLYKEYQASDTEVRYLPERLAEGNEWSLKKNLRARALYLEEIEVPAFPGTPLEAMRVEYETFHGEGETSSPGWYTEGLRWFAPGIGMLKEDLTAMAGPPEAREIVERTRRELVLEEFRNAGTDDAGR